MKTCRELRCVPAVGRWVALVLLLATGAAGPAIAQWRIDGTPVATTAGRQTAPLLVADGAGGCYIAWVQENAGAYTLYGQRFDAQGQRLWSATGKALCAVADAPYLRALIPFGPNEAIGVWSADRGVTSVYAQRTNAAGDLLWGANGALVSDAPSVSDGDVVADGTGGVIVTWSDFRGPTQDVYAQRMTGSGAPQWGAGGVPVSAAASHQFNPRVVADGTGGAFLAWRDLRSGSSGVFAQRLTASGAPVWAVDGLEVAASSFGEFGLEADGAGGMIVLWTDAAGAKAQRLNAAGQALWGPGGTLVAAGAGYVNSAADATGRTTVGFNRWVSASDADVFAQRLDASGNRQWTANGVPVAARAGIAEYPVSIEIEATGATVLMIACQDSSYRVQRLDASGAAQWGPTGAAISPTKVELDYRGGGMALDGAGGAFTTWSRPEGGSGSPPVPVNRTYVRRVPAGGMRTLSLDWGPGGRIDLLNPDPVPVRSVSVSALEPAAFRITPDFGYFINDVVLDGGSIGVPPDVDLGHPVANRTLYAGFSNGLWNGPSVQAPAGAYTTAAFPLAFTDGSVGAVLGALGAPDPKRWRLARWDPVAAAYAFAGSGLDSIRAGEGYWLVTADPTTVTPSGKPITASAALVDLAGDATSGWNQVGNPYRFAIADTALAVRTGSATVGLKNAANTSVDPIVWEWTGGSSYDSVGTLQPGRAYWVRKKVGGSVALSFPNRASTRAIAVPFARPAEAAWSLMVTARQGAHPPARVAVGVWRATVTSEPMRLEGPPPSAGGGLSLRVESPAGGSPLLACFDPRADSHEWRLELVAADAPGEVRFDVEAQEFPAELGLWLVDEARGQIYELRPGEPLTLAAFAGSRRLKIVAAPLERGVTAATPNGGRDLAYPNPFTGRVGLVLRARSPGSIQVTVHDLQGRLVRRLVSAAAAGGERVVIWDGRDASGTEAPSGIYLVRRGDGDGRAVLKLFKLGGTAR